MTIYMPESVLRELPVMVKNQLKNMTASQQNEFLDEYKRKRRSMAFCYLAHILFAVPYGYLNQWAWQIVFWLTCGGCGIWWLLLFFCIPNMTHEYNRDTAIDIIKDMKLFS